MDINQLPVDQLEPSATNPRVALQPDDPEYEQLAQSILRFGIVEPIIVNANNRHIIAGHQRFQVLCDLGHETVPVVELDVDEQHEQALAVALNKIEGRWDESKLLTIVNTLIDAEFDLVAIGVTDDDYDELLAAVDAAAATRLDDLDLDDLQGEPEDDEPEPVGPPDLDPTVAWYTLTFSVLEDQRKTILQALRAIRERNDFDDASAALVWLADNFDAEEQPT